MTEVNNVPSYILVYAFRYAITRRSYASSEVAAEIYKHWDSFDCNTQNLIQCEIGDARYDGLIDSIDLPHWNKIYHLKRKEC